MPLIRYAFNKIAATNGSSIQWFDPDFGEVHPKGIVCFRYRGMTLPAYKVCPIQYDTWGAVTYRATILHETMRINQDEVEFGFLGVDAKGEQIFTLAQDTEDFVLWRERPHTFPYGLILDDQRKN